MHLVLVAIEIYLAITLGVSGLAKAEYPDQFEATLRRHGILPKRTLRAASRLIPIFEIVVAALLVTGIAPRPSASVALVLFLSFLLTEIVLLATRQSNECGCYGVAFPRKVDAAGVAASTILVSLAAFHLWGVTQVTSVPWDWRMPGIVVLGGGTLWLLAASAGGRHWYRRTRRRVHERGPLRAET